MARIEDSSRASAFSEVYNFATVLAFSSSELLLLAFFSSGSNVGRVQGATLLELAQRWITPHIPAAAQSAECAYSSAGRVSTRAFDLVAGNQKLPVRIQNIC